MMNPNGYWGYKGRRAMNCTKNQPTSPSKRDGATIVEETGSIDDEILPAPKACSPSKLRPFDSGCKGNQEFGGQHM